MHLHLLAADEGDAISQSQIVVDSLPIERFVPLVVACLEDVSKLGDQ